MHHWDEWVPESRVLKYNDANLRRQKDLLKQHGKDKAKRGKPSKFTKGENGKETSEKPKRTDIPQTSSEPKKKKSRVESSVENEDASLAKVEVNVQIPDALKPILVDDWDLIMRQKQVCQLPAEKTVEDILKTYMEKSSDSVENKSTLRELTSGIKEYFDVMLGSQLLYRFERPQYNEILEKYPDLTMSQIYGSFHLLRFFVKIGSVLAYTNLSEKNMAILVRQLQKFLDYLQENVSTMFDANNYKTTTSEYCKKVPE
ncbi:unnamed protein product [Clavelina lepadiformis]|uniref:MRG domain-containing protein n=1 Tax=Clavelina lepadiformis TaxID=159417 RepID=A0ABP0FW77_CLALP